MFRIAALFAFMLTLTACATPREVEEPTRDLGDFVLSHNIVVAPDLVKGPLSREASDEKWIREVKGAIDARLGRYEGTRLVHLGVNIGGYVLAQPGVPLVASPKSLLIFNVSAWDDRAGGKFHEEAVQMVVSESPGAGTVVGTGLTKSADEQMQDLAYNAAKAIENWLAESAACMTEDPTPAEMKACWQQPKATADSPDR